VADKKPTRRRVPVREHTTFTTDAGGNVVAHFAYLDISGVGSTEDQAWDVLRSNANEALSEDEALRNKFEKFAEEFGVDEEVPQEEIDERNAMIAASHEASKDFMVLNLDTLDDAIAGDTPVLIDFWAEWCMPCHMMAPVLKEVSEDLAGRMTVAKVDTDANKQVWERFSIEGIPTLILFRKGEELTRIVGAGRPKEVLIEELTPHLG
jgi:thioredoxin 1